ncbi:MAG: hypothetical protein ACE5I3_08570 [Phycisphaerae bacterium]
MIVELSPRQWHLKQVVLGVLLLALLLWGAIESGTIDGDWPLILGLVAGLTLFYFITFSLRVGGRSRLLLTDRGVRFDDPSLDCGWIEWTRVERAKYSWLFGRLYLIGTDRRKLLRIDWKRLGSPTAARRCVRAINAQRRRYCRKKTDR